RTRVDPDVLPARPRAPPGARRLRRVGVAPRRGLPLSRVRAARCAHEHGLRERALLYPGIGRRHAAVERVATRAAAAPGAQPVGPGPPRGPPCPPPHPPPKPASPSGGRPRRPDIWSRLPTSGTTECRKERGKTADPPRRICGAA